MHSRLSLSLIVCLAPALCGTAALCQSRPQGPSASVNELLRKAITEQQSGDMKAAIEDYRKALAMQPGLAEARANLGAALAAVGDFSGAIEEDKRALANAPDKTAVRMNLALAYYKSGDWQNAAAEFAKVHAARPNDLNPAMLLGYSQIKTGHAAEAAALLQPMETGNEGNMDFEYVLAYALIESGNVEQGLPRMEASAHATHSVDAFVIAGSARMRRREFKAARADLDEAVKLDPNFPGAQSLAGQARDLVGDGDAARPALEAALRQDANDMMANLYLGAEKLRARDLDGARPLLERAAQLAPDYPQARFQLAKLNSITGKYAEAAVALEALEKADPNWLDPHIELAALYYKLHRPEDGQRERKIVQELQAREQKQGPQ